jgi:hypothetical protein
MKKLMYAVCLFLCISFLGVVIADCQTSLTPYARGGHGGRGPGIWCFIATATYDDVNHPHVMILREFRDKYLLTNSVGTFLTDEYYKHSPVVAEFITEHGYLKPIVKLGLEPIVGFSYLMNQL